MLKVGVMPLTSCNYVARFHCMHCTRMTTKNKNFDARDRSQHVCSPPKFGPPASRFALQDLMPVPQTPRICAFYVLC